MEVHGTDLLLGGGWGKQKHEQIAPGFPWEVVEQGKRFPPPELSFGLHVPGLFPHWVFGAVFPVVGCQTSKEDPQVGKLWNNLSELPLASLQPLAQVSALHQKHVSFDFIQAAVALSFSQTNQIKHNLVHIILQAGIEISNSSGFSGVLWW